MTERALKRGDRVEWQAFNRVAHGVVEKIGVGKHDGIVMVVQDGDPRSRPVSYDKLSRSRKAMPWVPTGDSAA